MSTNVDPIVKIEQFLILYWLYRKFILICLWLRVFKDIYFMARRGEKLKEKVLLRCFNPQGVVELPKPSGLINPRVKDLALKKIAIIWDGKKGGENFCAAVEELLNKRYPTATTIRLV
jgi:hypothetical protein